MIAPIGIRKEWNRLALLDPLEAAVKASGRVILLSEGISRKHEIKLVNSAVADMYNNDNKRSVSVSITMHWTQDCVISIHKG